MNAPTSAHLLATLALHSGDKAIDHDPQETQEWRDAFTALVATQGPARARQILDGLVALSREQRVGWQPELTTPYVNSIHVSQQPRFPGDLAIEEKLGSLMRWNALAMVAKANAAYGELGGHIASYASAADLFEVGYNHFFKARDRATRLSRICRARCGPCAATNAVKASRHSLVSCGSVSNDGSTGVAKSWGIVVAFIDCHFS